MERSIRAKVRTVTGTQCRNLETVAEGRSAIGASAVAGVLTRLFRDELNIAYRPLRKSSFTVREVECPHSNELFRLAQSSDLVDLRKKILPPMLQRERVVSADVL